ncbi:hypothetical protein ACJX0J_035406, partial [Zea mays]
NIIDHSVIGVVLIYHNHGLLYPHKNMNVYFFIISFLFSHSTLIGHNNYSNKNLVNFPYNNFIIWHNNYT